MRHEKFVFILNLDTFIECKSDAKPLALLVYNQLYRSHYLFNPKFSGRSTNSKVPQHQITP
jgi:hypothetical protein